MSGLTLLRSLMRLTKEESDKLQNGKQLNELRYLRLQIVLSILNEDPTIAEIVKLYLK
jgi:hypothetical protein